MQLMVALVVVILALEPFYAFLTAGAASLSGHYTAWRLWDEALLALLIIGALYLLCIDKSLRTKLVKQRILWLILAYLLIQIIWGVVALLRHGVSAKALGYGWIVNTRFLLFFLAVWLLVQKTSYFNQKWAKLLLIPAAVVTVFGLLQFLVLPHNFLSHFGYNQQTIAPYETINHNSHYIRIESTLRGANPLGAYLVLIISTLAVLLLSAKRKIKLTIFLLAALAALAFSFSRSAWIGALISLVAVWWLGWRYKNARKAISGAILVVVIIAAGLVVALRHDARFENYFFHTQTNSQIKATSDEGHASALASGLHDLATDPLGDGPGTAGPASVYNNHPARIADNYFIQIGQESGWLGLAVFLAILAEVAYRLWLRREDNLPLALFASLLGISFVCLLSHAWTDDTLAFIWWGLAGIALGRASEPRSAG